MQSPTSEGAGLARTTGFETSAAAAWIYQTDPRRGNACAGVAWLPKLALEEREHDGISPVTIRVPQL